MAEAVVSAVLQAIPLESYNMNIHIHSQTQTQTQTQSQENNLQMASASSQRDQSSPVVAMAVTAAADQASTSEETEPPKKKVKLDSDTKSGINKLEDRLNGVFCCAVCLDLPARAVYQCSNGHLMCAGCLNHLLADARLKDETATCPNCRTEIGKGSCCRNLAVEKAISQLPATCKFCADELPRSSLPIHEREQCEERIASCKYGCAGCPWKGPFHERQAHERKCSVPDKAASQVLPCLEDKVARLEEQITRQSKIFDLLSLEHMSFHELQLKPYRTDEYIHKLYYETSRFSSFGQQWVVKARVNDNQREPSLSVERVLSYQLVLKGKPSSSTNISFLVLKGPYGDVNVDGHIYQFEFTSDNTESNFYRMPIDSVECNKLLASAAISFRLLLFQTSK